MKTDIHPEYVLATVTCSCGNTFQTRSTKPELHVEICSQCHPFYTGKQKLVDTGGRVERFQRRLERAERAKRAQLGAAAMANVGGQAVLEGVMMRGPGNWAVAVRTPRGDDRAGLAADRLGDGAPLACSGCRSIRGVMALGESLAIGFRALAISANYARAGGRATTASRGRDRALARRAHLRVRDRDRLRGRALQGDAGRCITELLPITNGAYFVIVEGADPRHRSSSPISSLISLLPDLRRVFQYHAAEHKAINAYEAGRGARAGDRAALLAHPPALRHRVPALGDGDRRLRVRVLRPARLVLADRDADPAAAGDRRARVRADPLRRQAPGQPRR